MSPVCSLQWSHCMHIPLTRCFFAFDFATSHNKLHVSLRSRLDEVWGLACNNVMMQSHTVRQPCLWRLWWPRRCSSCASGPQWGSLPPHQTSRPGPMSDKTVHCARSCRKINKDFIRSRKRTNRLKHARHGHLLAPLCRIDHGLHGGNRSRLTPKWNGQGTRDDTPKPTKNMSNRKLNNN